MPRRGSEAAAIRAWAASEGIDVGDHGRLPRSLRAQWLEAGHPWPDPGPPDGWEPTPNPASTRKPRGDTHRRRTGSAPATTDQVPVDPAAPPAPDLFVQLVTGGRAKVLTPEEADWFNESKAKYREQHRFTEHTDLQDLDRLLTMELMQFRWGQWVMQGHSYGGGVIDEMEFTKKLKEQSAAIQSLKDSMGLTKKARDAHASGVSERWTEILRRAKQFGYHRVDQLRVALVLMNDLSAIVGSFDRSDEEERIKLGYPDEHSILEWVRNEMLPKYQEVDAHFRNNVQAMWTKL